MFSTNVPMHWPMPVLSQARGAERMRQIFLDTETTGLDPAQGHRLIEIAAVEMVDRKFTGQHYHCYVHPERNIDPEAERVHGISLEFLQDKPRFAVVADEFLRFVDGAQLIIHNAPFDVGFLDHELKRLAKPGIRDYCPSVIDTLVMAKEQYPGKRNSLDALCDRLDVDRSNRTLHGALIDCELLAEVYLAMTRGQEKLLVEPDETEVQVPEVSYQFTGDVGDLRVVAASDAEIKEHTSYLADLDKAAKGGCVWLAIEGSAQHG